MQYFFWFFYLISIFLYLIKLIVPIATTANTINATVVAPVFGNSFSCDTVVSCAVFSVVLSVFVVFVIISNSSFLLSSFVVSVFFWSSFVVSVFFWSSFVSSVLSAFGTTATCVTNLGVSY